jgi:hypothetical protein
MSVLRLIKRQADNSGANTGEAIYNTAKLDRMKKELIGNKIEWKKSKEEMSGLAGRFFYVLPHKWIFSSPCVSFYYSINLQENRAPLKRGT